MADAIVQAHLATMLRLDVEYDVLPRESEILHLQFWAAAFELLKERKAIYFETEGKNAGCWVMPAASFSDEAEDSKVIVRSNGTVTYVGKDIAYQLWKFGLLGKDFYYRPLHDAMPTAAMLWVTTDQPTANPRPQFGHGTRVYNVIDARQSYLQDVVVAGLRALGYERTGRPVDSLFLRDGGALAALLRRPRHPAFRRRPQAALRRSLRPQRPRREGRRPDGQADRQGAGGSGLAACRKRRRQEQRAVATQIAIGALRYFLLKFTRNSVIAFDFQEALSFEGETGPYVQYAAVRARNILRKLEESGETLPGLSRRADAPKRLARQLAVRGFLAGAAGRIESRCGASSAPSRRASRRTWPSTPFNSRRRSTISITSTPSFTRRTARRKVFLLWMTDFFRAQLERTLGVLGIETPPYM